MSNKMPERMSDKMSEYIPNRMSNRMPGFMPERMSVCLYYIIYIYIHICQILPNTIPGDMSETVPEYFVRVGITPNEAIATLIEKPRHHSGYCSDFMSRYVKTRP
jgi:hypothetical protein